MLKSHIKITLRKLYREKLYALINIVGLSLGLACCLLLGLYLHGELTYDLHHKKHARIYRVANELTTAGAANKLAVTSPALAPALKKEYPEIEAFVRMAVITPPDSPGLPFYTGDDIHYWSNVYTVDPGIFKVFDHEIISGDPNTALVDPNFIAVSQTFARTHFGGENPMDKTVCTDVACVKISLVFADLPANSHLKYDVLISYNYASMRLDETRLRENLWNFQDYTYLLMPDGFEPDSFGDKFQAFYDKYMKDIGMKSNRNMKYWLEPLAGIHYHSDLQYDEAHGNIVYLYGFTAVALLILLVACINYMNLATARSLKRAREVGMQKVLGASPAQLLIQYLGESVLFALCALAFSLAIVEIALTLTPISELTGHVQLSALSRNPILLWGMLAFTLITGLASGIYPALYLAAIPPIAALTAVKKAATRQFRLRQFLVLTQFIISIGVIAGVLLMAWQMRYISQRSLGFEKENRLSIRLYTADILDKYPTIKAELEKAPNVLGVTLVGAIPGQFMGFSPLPVENNDGSMGQQTVKVMSSNDDDVIRVMGMQLVEGRDFARKLLTDVGTSIIVNEAMVRKMGWDRPLGKRVADGRVTGVVKDFNYESLRVEVAPLMIPLVKLDFTALRPEFRVRQSRMMVVNIAGVEATQTLGHIRDVMARLDPKHTFEYQFLDDALDKLYTSERRIMQLTSIFAAVCVFISCLGLFGLASFTTEQRTKEIGVRKVLGASGMRIILMLSVPALALVLIASVFASGLAYLAINQWLGSFAYRASINPLIFVSATAMVIVVAFITIALQSFRTANANPVLALRYE